MKFLSLRFINNALTVLNLGLAVYILVFPFLANIQWWLQYDAPLQILTPPVVTIPAKGEKTQMANTLYIPAIGLVQQIYEGDTTAVLDKGAWRRPAASTPSNGSNTVIVAHRFSYANVGVFYHLDKVKAGDEIGVYWEGKVYKYKVRDVRIVQATAVEVEQGTDESTLTLYTCTPLWNPKDRLVVTALLQEEV